MTIYYSAKDIEEMSAKGIRQIEVGPGITLTDFARETAQQLNVALVDSSRATSSVQPAASPAQPAAPSRPARVSGKYNKPSGCMHGSNPPPAARSQAAVPSNPSTVGASSNTVSKLIDLMGNVMKRGG